MGNQVCLDMILERMGPVSMPLSSVALFYDGGLAGLDDKQLARVVLALLCLEHGILSLVRLEPWLVSRMESLLGLVDGFLGLAGSFLS